MIPASRKIAAISTPLGEGSVGVIRISGEDAFVIADKAFKSFSGKKIADIAGYTALYGEITDGTDKIDNAVALKFVAPKSYTGENVVELSVHGGRYVVKRVLRTVLSFGAKAAAPGEFTKRAFLNGKLDLAQAEAVMGVISAQSDSELKITLSALSGKVSNVINEIKASLLSVAASVAFFNDNPDEEIPELSTDNFGASLLSVSDALSRLIADYDSGRVLREGVDTVILGKPNVGKSTLMNLLSKRERSIVTDVAGTTRDIIEDTVLVGDITLRLSDTAGIHKTEDEVENVGIRLAREKSSSAQLVLAVFDISRPLDNDDIELIESVRDKNTIAVLNKSDSAIDFDIDNFKGMPTVIVSAKSGTGEKELAQKIAEVTGAARISADSAVLGSERQRDCALRAKSAVGQALEALNSGITVDAVGVLIDEALAELYTLTGERVTNAVADEVFERFCVGK